MIAYLRLLVKDRLMAWNPMSKQRAGNSKAKTVLGYIGYCLIFLMLYGMLVFVEVAAYRALAALGQPQLMLTLVYLLCTLLTFFTSFFYVISTLFFAKDVEFVSSLPISSRGLLTAKLLMITASETGIALAVCLPVILLFGIGQGMGVGYYFRALLILPFVPMVPITVVTLLSFLLIRASALWKRREGLTTVMTFVFLGVYFWFIAKINSGSDEESMQKLVIQFVTQQKQLFSVIAGFYPPIGWIANSLLGGGLAAAGWWFLFALGSAAVLAAVCWLLGASYQRLAIKQSEALTRLNAGYKRKAGAERRRTPFKALYRHEMRDIFTIPIYTVNSLSTAVVVPMMLIVMFFSMREQMSELSQLAGLAKLLPGALYVAIASAAFAFSTSMNMAAGTAVSREGKRHDFYKTLPVPARTMMLAKLCMGLTIDGICAAPILLLLLIALPFYAVQTLLGFCIGMMYGTLSTAFSIAFDAARPRLGWKTETEAIKQNGNSAISMFASMGVTVALGFGCYGLTTLGVSLYAALAILAAVLAVGAALMVARLLGKTSRKYILREG